MMMLMMTVMKNFSLISEKVPLKIGKKKQKLLLKSGSSTPSYTPTRFSVRTNKIVSYAVDDDNDADLMDSEDEAYANSYAVQDYIVENPTGKLRFISSPISLY